MEAFLGAFLEAFLEAFLGTSTAFLAPFLFKLLEDFLVYLSLLNQVGKGLSPLKR